MKACDTIQTADVENKIEEEKVQFTDRPQVVQVPSKQRGMTLIEIMVVLTIIVLVGGFVGVKVFGFLKEAKVKGTKQNMRTIMESLEQYRRRHSAYPSTEQGLEALVTKPSSGKIPENYPSEGYLPRVPKDSWGHEFLYTSPGGEGHEYEIISLGADKQEGGEDDKADIKSYELEKETSAE